MHCSTAAAFVRIRTGPGPHFFGGGSFGHAGRSTSSACRAVRIPESVVGCDVGAGGIGGAAIGGGDDAAIGAPAAG
jgi:hypothetical protein